MRARAPADATAALPPDPLPRFGDRRAIRIGLLGGSFNPAHAGHAHVAHVAARRLGLAQVWLMVSPGNPLKPARGMAPLAQRLASARAVADGRRVLATAIEQRLGTRYTVDTLDRLRQHFPRARFVWLMGADLMIELPRWRRWRHFLRVMPFIVLPRPGYTRAALSGCVARRLAHARRTPAGLAGSPAPAWAVLGVRQMAVSASALRAASARDGSRSVASARDGSGRASSACDGSRRASSARDGSGRASSARWIKKGVVP